MADILTETYQRIRHRLKAGAGKILTDANAAEDALQDAFVRLWKRYPIRNEKEAEALLSRTVRNASIDQLRKRKTVLLDEDLPDVLACTDLVLSRAGANALCEFQALGRPMLLVPYPKGASRGDQILNAQSLEKRGLCRVLLQEDMTPATLWEAIRQTWADRDQLTEALRNAPPADGTSRVLELIEEIQK